MDGGQGNFGPSMGLRGCGFPGGMAGEGGVCSWLDGASLSVGSLVVVVSSVVALVVVVQDEVVAVQDAVVEVDDLHT